MRISWPTFLALCLLLNNAALAQNRYSFSPWLNVPVTIGNDTLSNAWAGGLNYPSFASADVTGDQLLDLLVYDRARDLMQAYVQKTINGSSVYRYDPAISQQLSFTRPDMEWVLTYDYNCDGQRDVMVGTDNYLYAYQNQSSGGSPQFLAFDNGNPLKTQYANGNYAALEIPGTDLPALGDADADGDMDILVYGTSNVRLNYHENLSPNHCGLQFDQDSQCWGRFEESGLYRSVDLNSCAGVNKHQRLLHAGSSMALQYLNNDSLADLLLGNISYTSLTALFNGGSQDSAVITSQDTLYPNPRPLNNVVFPAPYLADGNFDGRMDLMVSSFSNVSSGSPNSSSNYQGIWYYEDTSTTTQSRYVLRTDSFLQAQQIDFGGNAVPRLADFNGDSLPDLVVAIGYRLHPPRLPSSQLYYFANTGTAGQPHFTLRDTNFANLLQYSLGESLVPAFGDLDNDQDLDMIVGTISGYFHEFENTGSATNPQFNLKNPILTNTDVGADAAPFLYDIEEDGDLDLFVGNEKGRIAFYRNQGDSLQASFSLINRFYGAVDVATNVQGQSIPFFYRDSSGTTLLVGSWSQGVRQYQSLDSLDQLPAQLQPIFGNGATASATAEETPFGIAYRSGRNQFLIRARELKQAGLRYGYIQSLSFHISDKGSSSITSGITLRLKNTRDTALTRFHQQFSGPAAVFDRSVIFGNGWNNIGFDNAFEWDGRSNLLVEICFSANFPGNNIHVKMSPTPFYSHALGDISGYNNFTADGCTMPYERSIRQRPDVRINLTPAARPAPPIAQPQLQAGLRSAPFLAQLDADPYLDAVVGTAGGGLQLFKGKAYPVSLPENTLAEASLRFSLFPNPARETLTITQPLAQPEPIQRITLRDLTGRLLLSKPIHQRETTLSVAHLPAGLYIVTAHFSGPTQSQKLLIR